MRLDNPRDNRESQSTPSGLSAYRSGSIKTLKNVRQVFLRNANASIAYREVDSGSRLGEFDADASSRIGIADRVLQQIQDYLDQSGLIAHDADRLRDLDLKPDPLLGCQPLGCGYDCFHETIQRDRFTLKLSLSFVSSRQR